MPGDGIPVYCDIINNNIIYNDGYAERKGFVNRDDDEARHNHCLPDLNGIRSIVDVM